jgi:hypothetical protein
VLKLLDAYCHAVPTKLYIRYGTPMEDIIDMQEIAGDKTNLQEMLLEKHGQVTSLQEKVIE